MLENLIIKNFAIIEDINVSFNEGMNVITGETGAGKSLIIDTISLLAGSRSEKELIRHGESFAYIYGRFTTNNPDLLSLLSDLGLANLEKPNQIEISREIRESKSKATVNNKPVTLLDLKSISNYLVDIHVQHDLFKLIDEANYLNYLDDDTQELTKLKNDYVIALEKYNECYSKYKNLLNSKKNSQDKLSYLEFELKELTLLDLKPNEDLEIEQELTKLSNYDRIFESLKESYNLLDNESINLDSIYDSAANLRKIEDLDPAYKDLYEEINDAYYRLDEAKAEIYRLLSNSEFDPKEFDRLQERSYELRNIKEKYHKSLAELISYRDSLEFEIEKITNYDGLVKELEASLNKLGNTTYNCGILLSKYRKNLAKGLEKQIIKECQDLDLIDIDFAIEFKEIPPFSITNLDLFYPNGLDQINFLVSFNKGEPKYPLNKVASGGELSRVMLAFKSIFARRRNLSLIVFDEIDTGVSGDAALMIAKKIKAISKNQMVISITHMPQVSAIADYNYYVYKEEENNRTKAHIKMLSQEEKVYKLAEMLSGRNITASAINHAKELIELTKKISL